MLPGGQRGALHGLYLVSGGQSHHGAGPEAALALEGQGCQQLRLLFGELEDIAHVRFGKQGGGLYVVGGCGGAAPLPASGIQQRTVVAVRGTLGGAAVHLDLHRVIMQQRYLLLHALGQRLDHRQRAHSCRLEKALRAFDVHDRTVAHLMPQGDGEN